MELSAVGGAACQPCVHARCQGRKGAQGAASSFFATTPEGTSFSAGSFGDLHLSRPLLKACAALGYTQPTPIQVRPLLVPKIRGGRASN